MICSVIAGFFSPSPVLRGASLNWTVSALDETQLQAIFQTFSELRTIYKTGKSIFFGIS